MMVFENPHVLWLLPPLFGLLLVLGFWGWGAKKEIAKVFQVNLRRSACRHAEKYIIAGALITLIVFALSLPSLPYSSRSSFQKAGEIALVVDVTGSMAAQVDLDSPNRLERVKPILYQVVDRMEELGGVRISLHGFTSIARSLVPFVGKEDYAYLRESIRKVLHLHCTPGQGSNLKLSLLDVVEKFSKEGKAKLIIFFSDGEVFYGGTRGLPAAQRVAAQSAAMERTKALGIRVVTLGVGERQGARIPLYDKEGKFSGEYAKLQGADYVSYLKEDGLREMAFQTGGRYFFERNREGLIRCIEEGLEPGARGTTSHGPRAYHSVAHWFLMAALPVLIVFTRRHLL